MLLIVGLGNPGPRYRCTRHNVGFRCVDLMARKWGIRQSERRAKAVFGRGNYAGKDIVLAKPRTFMNNSGEGVAYLLARFAATPADLVVIYDEMDLPLGRIRIRPEGSAAGHNGMRSIISVLDSQLCARIRVGIGRPHTSQDEIGYVLGSFTKQENDVVQRSVDRVAQAVGVFLADGINEAMNQFNQESA